MTEHQLEYFGTRAAIDRLDEVLREAIEPDVLRIYWTHWTAHNVHWAIRHGFSAERFRARRGSKVPLASIEHEVGRH